MFERIKRALAGHKDPVVDRKVAKTWNKNLARKRYLNNPNRQRSEEEFARMAAAEAKRERRAKRGW